VERSFVESDFIERTVVCCMIPAKFLDCSAVCFIYRINFRSFPRPARQCLCDNRGCCTPAEGVANRALRGPFPAAALLTGAYPPARAPCRKQQQRLISADDCIDLVGHQQAGLCRTGPGAAQIVSKLEAALDIEAIGGSSSTSTSGSLHPGPGPAGSRLAVGRRERLCVGAFRPDPPGRVGPISFHHPQPVGGCGSAGACGSDRPHPSGRKPRV